MGQGTALACYFVWHYSQLTPFPHMPVGEAAFDLYMVTFFNWFMAASRIICHQYFGVCPLFILANPPK
ncbi:hypothetical protein OL548_17765 [Lysinibacillus sp. MHQ-1]|nr:hypothetical protein OL548_17765 [Lysinibacillus sp. MHQ-1]